MTVNYFPFLDDGERRKGRVQKTRSYGGARHGYPRSFSNEIDTIAAKLDLPMRFPIRWNGTMQATNNRVVEAIAIPSNGQPN